jgi:predicted nucleic acid-binding protein
MMSGEELRLRRVVEKHKIVGLDTAPLIYFIEDVAPYADLVEPIFRLLESGRTTAVTSTITLAEVLTKPLSDKNLQLVDEIKFTLKSLSTLSLIPVGEAIAEAAALIRARYTLRLPDALQVASAIQGGATLFITNDGRFKKVEGIETVVLEDYVRR